MLNFEKRNLRSGHLIRPGHVTFGVSWSSFFGNMSNCWLNSYGKFGGTTRRRFLAICEKPYGGVEINPPAGARVKVQLKASVHPSTIPGGICPRIPDGTTYFCPRLYM